MVLSPSNSSASGCGVLDFLCPLVDLPYLSTPALPFPALCVRAEDAGGLLTASFSGRKNARPAVLLTGGGTFLERCVVITTGLDFAMSTIWITAVL